jgi:tRNA pseudouridine32 synthase/23S rRNA pseudouridine746 synthase
VTSGVLLLAKNAETAKLVSDKFRQGSVIKYYCGISGRKASKKKQGWVKGNMVKGRRKSWMLTRPDDKDTNPKNENYAVTRFFTSSLSPLSDKLLDATMEPRTLILFRPHTGKTHQLRVAAKSLGLPLFGDPIYRDGFDTPVQPGRTFLHSTVLHLDFQDGESVTIYSPPPFGDLLWNQQGSGEFHSMFQLLLAKHSESPDIKQVFQLIN